MSDYVGVSDHDPCLPERNAHCEHQTQRDTYRGGNTTVHETRQCCFCGRIRTLTYRSGRDPRHGPYAPPMLILDTDETKDQNQPNRGTP